MREKLVKWKLETSKIVQQALKVLAKHSKLWEIAIVIIGSELLHQV